MREHTTSGVPRLRAAAERLGLAVEVVKRPAAGSLEEAAQLLGVQPRDIAKTLVVRRGVDDYVLVLVPGGSQLSWPKLRATLGVSRLSLPDATEALAATGYERGTITPVGAMGDWPVVVDSGLMGRRVAMGAGEHGYSAIVATDDLVRAYEALVADIARE